MADFLETKRQEIADRLAELRPLVEEHTRLQSAVKALDSLANSDGAATATRPPRQARRRRPRASHTPAAATAAAPAQRRGGRPKGSGKRATQALAAIRSQPGMTVPEIAARIGATQNYIYKLLAGLAQEGKARKQGRGWHPAG